MQSFSREEKNGITQNLLREYFDYMCDGSLVWIKRRGRRGKIGSTIGWVEDNGRSKCQFFNHKYELHRIIWFFHNGPIPVGIEVSHIDKNPSNNRIENLRLASHIENTMRSISNTSGFPGISWQKKDKLWVVMIFDNGKSRYCGSFKTIEEAIYARRQAELKYGYDVRSEFHTIDKT